MTIPKIVNMTPIAIPAIVPPVIRCAVGSTAKVDVGVPEDETAGEAELLLQLVDGSVEGDIEFWLEEGAPAPD